MKNFTIIVSKKISGISTKHEKKAEFCLCIEWKKTLQLGEVRQDPFQWKVRYCNFDHFIFHVTYGLYQIFMHFHLEIRVLVASSVLTNAATLLADPRYIKISYHFSFMIKTANERIPFKNYITSVKSSLSHSLSFPLSLFPSLHFAHFFVRLLHLNMSSLSFSVSLFSLHFSLFSCIILF